MHRGANWRSRRTVGDSPAQIHTDSGSIVSVELSFGFMEEPNVERALGGLAVALALVCGADWCGFL
jgi:K+ transporter